MGVIPARAPSPAPKAVPPDLTALGVVLAKPLGGDTDADKPVTVSTFNRTLVATVTKGMNANPGDRLVWTWVDIRPNNFLFEGYTVVATENETLTVATTTDVGAAALSANLGDSYSKTKSATTNPPYQDPLASLTNGVSHTLGDTAGVSGSLSDTRTSTATVETSSTPS